MNSKDKWKDRYILIGILLIFLIAFVEYYLSLDGQPFDIADGVVYAKGYIIIMLVFVLGFSWAYDKMKAQKRSNNIPHTDQNLK